MTTVGYREADVPTIQLEVEAGAEGFIPRHVITKFPGTAEDDLTELPNILAALTTIDGRVDGIEALIGTTNTTLTTIDGRVDGIEAALATLNASNDPGTGVANQNTDIDNTSEALGSQACPLGAWVKNTSAGAQVITVSYTNPATVTNGYPLKVDAEHFFPCGNISELFVISDTADAKAAWHAI